MPSAVLRIRPERLGNRHALGTPLFLARAAGRRRKEDWHLLTAPFGQHLLAAGRPSGKKTGTFWQAPFGSKAAKTAKPAKLLGKTTPKTTLAPSSKTTLAPSARLLGKTTLAPSAKLLWHLLGGAPSGRPLHGGAFRQRLEAAVWLPVKRGFRGRKLGANGSGKTGKTTLAPSGAPSGGRSFRGRPGQGLQRRLPDAAAPSPRAVRSRWCRSDTAGARSSSPRFTPAPTAR